MTLVRGVLLAGKFRSHHELNTMSADDQRNTLIVVLSGLSNQGVGHYQAFDDATLAGKGAVLAFLREAGIRRDDELRRMSDDDQRNTLIVEIGAQTGMGRELQGRDNLDLVRIGLGNDAQPGVDLAGRRVSPIRGVLLAGNFRTQHELDAMTPEDQRNTLIVEMARHSRQPASDYQAMSDADLAGAGAAMVFLRGSRIRDDAALKTMSADDQRNTLIVEIDGQTRLGARLQELRTMDLVLAGLGVDPVFPARTAPLYVFGVDALDVRRQKADGDHSDSDWLSVVVTVGDAVSKGSRTFAPPPIRLEGSIKTGDIIRGRFETAPFAAEDADPVVITYVVANLGSTDVEAQFAEAVRVTDKIVQIAGPVVGAAIGLFFGAPGEGLEIGQKVAAGVDAAVRTLGDFFDTLGVHAGPPNCNGEVLHDALTFGPGELARAVHHPASRDYVGPQTNARCGGAPESTLHFSIRRFPPDGLVAPP